MTTVLDPTGLEFRVPATTFENVKFQYREYLGIEIFKDDGINNNLGAAMINSNVIRSSLSDDYSMWENSEEFIGSADEETAKDYAWSIGTRPFFADEKFVDLNQDGFLGNGEPMYRDTDFSNTITTGDIRINDITIDTEIRLSIVSYPAGSRVVAGDTDIAMQTNYPAIWTPRTMPVSVRYTDLPHGCEPANGTFDIGEPIYFNPALAAGPNSSLQQQLQRHCSTSVGKHMGSSKLDTDERIPSQLAVVADLQLIHSCFMPELLKLHGQTLSVHRLVQLQQGLTAVCQSSPKPLFLAQFKPSSLTFISDQRLAHSPTLEQSASFSDTSTIRTTMSSSSNQTMTTRHLTDLSLVVDAVVTSTQTALLQSTLSELRW